MNALRRALALVVEYRRSYLVLNAVYYGLVIAGMTFVAFNRDVQTALLEAVRTSIDNGASRRSARPMQAESWPQRP